jgi:hypothetical protein
LLTKSLFHTPHEILQHETDGFISHAKETVLWIFIALINLSLLTGFEPMNLGSKGKHYKYYTTEKDFLSF